MESVLVFILGLCIGSFLNVCIYRIPLDISVVTPRSHCPHCKQTLGWLDLLPIVSYVLRWGKCRYCGEGIPLRYPLVELGTGLGYLTLWWHFGATLEFITYTYLFSGLVVCSLIDYDHKIIPDAINLILLLGGIPLLAYQSLGILINGVMGALVGFGLLFLIALLSKGGMGGGDIKLAGVLGLYLGWPQILITLFLSFIIGSVVGLMWVVLKKQSLKSVLPFGPFLCIATLIVMLWGAEILEWYWQLFI